MKVLRTIVLIGLVAMFEAGISVTGCLAAYILIVVEGWLGWVLCLPVVVGTAVLAVKVKLALCAAFFPRKEGPA